MVNKIFLRDLNFLTRNKEDLNNDIMVKVRSTGKLLNCKFNYAGNEILLDKGEEGVSPSSLCILQKDSDGTRVLGGGWIKKQRINYFLFFLLFLLLFDPIFLLPLCFFGYPIFLKLLVEKYQNLLFNQLIFKICRQKT